MRHTIRFFSVAVLATTFSAACSDSSGPGVPPNTLESVSAVSVQAVAGSAVTPPPAVRVTDAAGNPVANVLVTFRVVNGQGSVSGAVTRSNSLGIATLGQWTVGTLVGVNSLVAELPGIPAIQFNAQVVAGPAASMSFVGQPGSTVENESITPPPMVELLDQFGNRATSSIALITLQLDQAQVGTVLTGVLTAASINGVATFTGVSVAAPGLAAPNVAAASPFNISSGAQLQLVGQGFGTDPAQREVLVNGVAAQVIAGNATSLTVIAPTVMSDCKPTRAVPVVVRVRMPSPLRLRASANEVSDAVSQPFQAFKAGTLMHPLQSAPQLALLPGESVVLGTASSARCVELAQTGGTYLFSVFSAESHTVSTVSYVFRSTPSQISQPVSHPSILQTDAERHTSRRAVGIGTESRQLSGVSKTAQQREEAAAHTSMLHANRQILQGRRHPRFISPFSGSTARSLLSPPAALTAAQFATLGAVNEFRYSFTSCFEGYSTIRARTAWIGQHVVILEDEESFGQPPLNNTLDARYAEIGAEFDNTMWPLITQNFGNPLAVDAAMSQLGKVLILFTPKVLATGAQAFVFSCDFFPRSELPKSNEAAMFYVRVPTESAPGFGPSTPAGWQWLIRSTILHETKHLASYAERVSRSGMNGFEEAWLEEGTARIAEELYGRTFYNNFWKDNSEAQNTFACDVSPELAQCSGTPFIMPKHFGSSLSSIPGLYEYLDRSETRSVLCIPPAACTDASFYSGAWALLRWVVDNFHPSEQSFFTALTQNSAVSGAAGLEALTASSWTTIMGEWTLAMATDDLPGFIPINPRLRFPSWNLRNVFAFVHSHEPVQFPKPYPLVPRSFPFVEFAHPVEALVSGGFSLFELTGVQFGRHVVALESPGGEPPPASLRMSIVRIN